MLWFPVDHADSSIPAGILPQNVCHSLHSIILTLADMSLKVSFLLSGA